MAKKKETITVVDTIPDIPVAAPKLREARPTAAQKIEALERENAELNELCKRQFEELRFREQEYERMRAYYAKKFRLVTDTIVFVKDTLMEEMKGA